MIIDIHTHVFPDALASRAVTVLAERSHVSPYTDGTCAGLLESMRRAGISKSCIAPIATKPDQARSINRWAKEISERHEQIISFGALHPEQGDWREEIDFLVSNGFRGIKLHPDYQEFFVDDPAIIPMLRALRDAGLIVLVHAGVDIGLPPPVHCTPDRLARLLDSVTGLTVIAAHMGGYQCWDDVERHLVGRNLYLDTSFSLADLGSERMAEIIRAHGIDKTLFGTDSPWTDQSAEAHGIRSLPFTDDEIAAILGGNARRLLQV